MKKSNADPLLRASREHAELVDVPEEAFISIDGRGTPYGPAFHGAGRALLAVAHAIRRILKEEQPAASALGPAAPLEALWWWATTPAGGQPGEKEWRWRLMIRQPPEATLHVIQRALARVRARRSELALDLVEYRHYAEGPSVQILHVGPYNMEHSALQRLHEEIAHLGLVPEGLLHEIYLGDPRRARPERLRTILRQPVRAGASPAPS